MHTLPRRTLTAAALTAALLATAVLPATAHGGSGGSRWNGAWTAAVQRPSTNFYPNWSEQGFDHHSVRQVVRTSADGSALRIRVSNAYGTTPLRLTGASVARSGDGAAVQPATLRTVRFAGAASVAVPAGAKAVSDAVPLPVRAGERLTVTLYFAGATGPATYHDLAQGTFAYRASGDHLRDTGAGAYTETSKSWYYLEGVEVAGLPARSAVATFGDSITDGYGATEGADERYPDQLSRRLAAEGRPRPVLNTGIGGNRILNDSACFGEKATTRFARDVLDQPRVGTVIVLEGTNDLLFGYMDPTYFPCGLPNARPTAAELIEGHRALIRAAHAKGIRVVGGTMIPMKGSKAAPQYPAEAFAPMEAVRDEVNAWIRTSGEYDAVVDFDRALADPAPGNEDLLNPDYDFGDGLHPNTAGYAAMARAVDPNAL
ncbi:SGNH/GDSL hydrolase family protein [Streptomyces sp. NPDC050842]|uniref:SGNH/GDSL hydrolase family protein n=1 Tax=Streptomyces sp. NPDC050842 TaxID=3365636 RepID=UPI0037A8DDDB